MLTQASSRATWAVAGTPPLFFIYLFIFIFIDLHLKYDSCLPRSFFCIPRSGCACGLNLARFFGPNPRAKAKGSSPLWTAGRPFVLSVSVCLFLTALITLRSFSDRQHQEISPRRSGSWWSWAPMSTSRRQTAPRRFISPANGTGNSLSFTIVNAMRHDHAVIHQRAVMIKVGRGKSVAGPGQREAARRARTRWPRGIRRLAPLRRLRRWQVRHCLPQIR